MLPRLKPYLGLREFLAFFRAHGSSVTEFEQQFAKTVGAPHALAFPYGRSGLFAFFAALDIRDTEVIVPAYTCTAVVNAIIVSGNRPVFVDIEKNGFNMDLIEVEQALTVKTSAVLATHMFGHTLDNGRLGKIIAEGEKRFGKKIWNIQDCALSFEGSGANRQGDIALYALNISKIITTVFGGMLTTGEPSLAEQIRAYRDTEFRRPALLKPLRRFFYLLAVKIAFWNPVYSLVFWIENNTRFLNRFTQAHHRDGRISLPPDFDDKMLPAEAEVGKIQLDRYKTIKMQRLKTIDAYMNNLRESESLHKPILKKEDILTQYTILHKQRDRALKRLQRAGVEGGRLFDYCLPEMPLYAEYARRKAFPNAQKMANMALNLPIHNSVSKRHRRTIILTLNGIGSS